MLSDIAELTPEVQHKEEVLRKRLSDLQDVLVAYSGGVDSAYLAYCAYKVLGDRAVAVTARSASMSDRELVQASALARDIGIRHQIIDTGELDRPEYVANSTTRCYYCKDTLFKAVQFIAQTRRDCVVLDGFNADDFSDYRPGHQAAAEYGVIHPLAEVGLMKSEIRVLSRAAGLRTWNKPQLACLASRVPYGMAVTGPRLGKIESLENTMKDLGFVDVRARLVKANDEMVRLEVGGSEVLRVVELKNQIVRVAKRLGFKFVTLDLEGFRSGRMNEGLVELPILSSKGTEEEVN